MKNPRTGIANIKQFTSLGKLTDNKNPVPKPYAHNGVDEGHVANRHYGHESRCLQHPVNAELSYHF